MLRIKRRPKGSPHSKKMAKQSQLGALAMPDDEEVNAIFEDTIMQEYVLVGDEQKKQLVGLSPAVKWQMICSRKAMHAEAPPAEVIEGLQKTFSEGVPDDTSVISDLVITIRSGSKTWLNGFLSAGGLEVVIQKLGEIEGKLNKTTQDVEVQGELLKCLKASMNNPLGIDWLMENPELVGILALNLDSAEPPICTLVLELLTVIMVNNAAGHQIVLDAMEMFKREKEESVRFLCLVNSLRSEEQPMCNKRDVMLFINTLINSAASLDERLLIRADLLYAGILEQVDGLKNAPIDHQGQEGGMSDERYELEVQIQVFEAVMLKDNTEATRTGSNGVELNLSDAEQLCKAVQASAVESGCNEHFMSVMQHLLVIPVIDKHADKMWEAIEKCVHSIVVKVDHDYSISLSELKGLLDAKERLEEVANSGKLNRASSLSGSVAGLPPPPSTPSDSSSGAAAATKDPRGALMAALATRGGGAPPPPAPPTPSEAGGEPDPRAALMKMMANRGAGAGGGGPPPGEAKKEAEEAAPDPRAALMKMMANRGGGGGDSAPAAEKAEGGGSSDPRGALMAALAKRGGGPTHPVSSPSPATTATSPAPGSSPAKRPGLPPGLNEPATPPDPNAPPPPPLPGTPDPPAAPSSSSSCSMGPPVLKPRTKPLPLPPGLSDPPMALDPDAPPPPPLPGTACDPPPSSAGACGPPVLKPRTKPLPLPPGLNDPPMALDPDAPPPPPLPGTASAAPGPGGGKPNPFGGGANPFAAKAGQDSGVPGKPKKASVKPPVPMKNLFWTKIPEGKIQSTVWEGLNDDKVKLDVAELEALFAKVDKKKAAATEAAEKSPATKKEKAKEIHLLDGKVLQNAGIALAKYKMAPADLVKAILAMDDKLFDFDGVKTLHTVAPTNEDMAALKEYDGEVAALGKVEQFFLEVMKIPNYPQRLECWMYKIKFQNQHREMTEAMEGVGRAVAQVKGSKKLGTLLEYVLALGNYLNGGTAQGGVYGVKLDVLLKLKTIKGGDNKTTLLDFLVKTCEAKCPDVLDLDKDFQDVEAATRFSFGQWKGDFGALRTGLKMIGTQLENVKKNPPMPLDRFQESFESWSKTVATSLDELQAKGEAVEKSFADALGFFGEDPAKCSPEEFFSLVLTFCNEFGRAKQESEKKRLMEEKAAKRKEAQERAAASAAKGGGSKPVVLMGVDVAPVEEESLVDNILDKIKSRNAEDILSTLKTGKTDNTRKLLSIVRKNSDEKAKAQQHAGGPLGARAFGGFRGRANSRQQGEQMGGGGGGDGVEDGRAVTAAGGGTVSDLHGTGLKSARANMMGTLSPKTLRMLRQQKAGMSGLGLSADGAGQTDKLPGPAATASALSRLGVRGPSSAKGMSAIAEDEAPAVPEAPETPKPFRQGSVTPPPDAGPAPTTTPPKKMSALEKLRAASSSSKKDLGS